MSKQSKKERRTRRRQSKLNREARRESRLQAPLRTSEGLDMIDRLDEFFVGYRLNPDPDRFEEMLSIIEKLNLLKLTSHRYGIAAMVTTVFHMHEDRQKAWLTKHRDLITSASHLWKDSPELDTVTDIDQSLVAWMVSGKEHYLDPVLELTYEQSERGEAAQQAVDYYRARCPDLEDLYQADRERHQSEAQRNQNQTAQKLREQADRLTEKLRTSPDFYRVAYVLHNKEAFVIGTYDGQEVEGAPILWYDYPVIHRQATKSERLAVEAWRKRQQEPI